MTHWALDLGSTRIKFGSLDKDRGLSVVRVRNAPPVEGVGGKRVSDPLAWLSLTLSLLKIPPKGAVLGVSTQRSSFLIWDRGTGKPLTPLISWQDVRSESWCGQRPDLADEVYRITGLPMTAHYAAPKLAMTLEQLDLLDRAHSGELAFGTLETWLIWNWTKGRCHITDLSVASRTCLVALGEEDWSPKLCERFGIPRALLPQIVLGKCNVPLDDGPVLTLTIADQTAGALPLFAQFPNAAYVNGGTGTFVMRAAQGRAPLGYLSAQTGHGSVFWEGAVNAGAALLKDRKLDDSLWEIPGDAFSLGDTRGLGSPYWRGDLIEARSAGADGLDDEGRARVDILGYLFRIRGIVSQLFPTAWPERLILSGGLAARENLASAVAAVCPCPVWTLDESELGLWGAAWLAAGKPFQPDLKLLPVAPLEPPTDLEQRYRAWSRWLDGLTGV